MIGWQETCVALIILIGMFVSIICAVYRYKTVEEALKVVAGLTALLGATIGIMSTYFFTRGQVVSAREEARQQKEISRRALKAAMDTQNRVTDVAELADRLSKTHAGAIPAHAFDDYRQAVQTSSKQSLKTLQWLVAGTGHPGGWRTFPKNETPEDQ